ncbi:MAG TPA: serine/threonine-protein kinase [Ktedonobacteraceae bacterium]|nr:serine/threonine-protein kinase [Ktedonobacteraceae bacterium]
MKTTVLKGKIVHERYIIEELLGQGGFGAVYRVRDRRVQGNVFALKEVADPNRDQQENFLFEGEILRRLDHPALPRVYRVFEDGKNNHVYMLMDYIEGPNLERLRLQQPERRFSLPQALKIMAPIMEALSYLHAQQPPIIHRDIKPANVIVSPLDEGAMLVDFGIAKEYDQDSTTAVIRHCSPGYGAPEQYVHGTSMQTDIYGLGATFYALLTGEVPIDALYRITRLSAKKSDPLVSANELDPSVSVAVANILQRAMAVNSSDRFATVQEFWEALQAYVDEVQEFEANRAASGSLSSTTTLANLSYPSELTLADADLPSSTGGKVWKGPHPQRKATGQKHMRSLLAGLVVLILVALTSGMAMGSLSMLSGVKNAKPWQGVSLMLSKSPPSPPAITQPSSAQDEEGHSDATENSPSVALSYTGTIHNTLRNMDATLSLSHMRQDEGHISGDYTVEAGLVEDGYYSMQASFIDSGYFTGRLIHDGKIRILIPAGENSLPVLFEGQFQSNGSISGTYCSYWHHQCDYSNGEYGSWHVTPQDADR